MCNEDGRWMEMVRLCVQRNVVNGVGEARGRGVFESVICALTSEGHLGARVSCYSRRHSKVLAHLEKRKWQPATFVPMSAGNLNIGDLDSARFLSWTRIWRYNRTSAFSITCMQFWDIVQVYLRMALLSWDPNST